MYHGHRHSPASPRQPPASPRGSFARSSLTRWASRELRDYFRHAIDDNAPRHIDGAFCTRPPLRAAHLGRDEYGTAVVEAASAPQERARAGFSPPMPIPPRHYGRRLLSGAGDICAPAEIACTPTARELIDEEPRSHTLNVRHHQSPRVRKDFIFTPTSMPSIAPARADAMMLIGSLDERKQGIGAANAA